MVSIPINIVNKSTCQRIAELTVGSTEKEGMTSAFLIRAKQCAKDYANSHQYQFHGSHFANGVLTAWVE